MMNLPSIGRPIRLHFLWVLVLPALTTRCTLSHEESVARLNSAVKKITQNDVQSAVLWIDAPNQGIQQGFAHGWANAKTRTPMTLETPFFSASVGKLFIATTILKFAAEGKLSIDAPITQYISKTELSGLPLKGGDSAFEHLTLSMLLSHRTGLPDYFSDPSRDHAPRLFDRIATETQRKWTRSDLLNYARDHYHAVGSPGEKFHYSDTNYDLLGMVLEKVGGKPFHQVVRENVFEPMKLTQTWYHAMERRPEGVEPEADIWVNKKNLRDQPSLSADQAGGGLITTVTDLRIFLRSLVHRTPVGISAFQTDFTENAMHAGIDVGRGIWRIRPRGVFFGLAGLPALVGHSGATGVWAYYAPEWDAVIVGAVSDSSWQEKHIEFLLREVIPVLARIKNPS